MDSCAELCHMKEQNKGKYFTIIDAKLYSETPLGIKSFFLDLRGINNSSNLHQLVFACFR